MAKDLYTEQVKLLLDVMPFVVRQKCFALKGGTAINLFINDFPRLSVDIDLTYLPIEPRAETLKGIHEALTLISKDITKELKRLRPGIKVKGTGSQLSKLIVADQKAQIKIEPNLVLRGQVFPSEMKRISPRVREIFSVELEAQLMSVPDIYGGKICAALDRQHPRDLFDIKDMYETVGLTDDIRKAFIVYLASHSRPMHEVLKPTLLDIAETFESDFEGMAFKEVRSGELLAARERLINDISNQITSDEKRFLLSVKEGKPEWNALGIAGIESLPAIQWKLSNIGKIDTNKHKNQINKLKEILGI